MESSKLVDILLATKLEAKTVGGFTFATGQENRLFKHVAQALEAGFIFTEEN